MSLRQSGSTLLHLTGSKCASVCLTLKENPHVAEIHWYQVDDMTHGSVAIYHSKEAYEANLAYQAEVRSKSTGGSWVTRCFMRRMVKVMSISPLFNLCLIQPYYANDSNLGVSYVPNSET
ncbi:MAG: hypothetical protein CM15mP115_00030 [Alphaproteobacteria bacterium]|nr:MAG: hypothetical protein CM15mP115_00030 [Alphaproteobacteria bacterium]